MGNTVWEYINPVTRNGILTQGESPTMNPVFKIYRYSSKYSGLDGKELSRKGTIENYTTDVGNENSLPFDFKLRQNYPNPFNSTTTITYQLPDDGFATLNIYNILGQKIATLVNEFKPSGKYDINFNADNLASGVYIYKLKINFTKGKSVSFLSATKKFILLK